MAAKKVNTEQKKEDNNDNKDINIEDGFLMLNKLLDDMESEDMGIEESFDLYKKGVELVKILNSKLDDVEGKLNEVN